VSRVAAQTLHASALLTVTGVLAVVSGEPFVFPSLGPSAYVLATSRDETKTTARRVLGGHTVGVVAGFLAYHALAAGLRITAETPAFALDQTQLVASGVLAVAGTTAGMLATETRHAPACATTLIVSLGLLSSLAEASVILVAVAVLFGTHAVFQRFFPASPTA
jgi:CBS-domain-containing membrane protein